MASQPNVINQLINPLQVQTFQRYIPTAFDEGMTLLEKVNKIIVTLNQMGKLSNDVLDQWNQVMDWIMADGLDAAIDAKIDAMLADGSLATVIGNAITDLGTRMDALTQTVADNKTALENEMTQFKTDTNTSITNFENTINSKIFYGTPEQYGAKGDGTTDDTTAIQNCLNACLLTQFSPVAYRITKPLHLPKYHALDGNNGKLIVSGGWSSYSFGASVPVDTILWVEGREPIAGTELESVTKVVKDLRIEGDTSINHTGIYIGTADKNQITQATSVNYAVYGYTFTNIIINKCYDGVSIGEAWGCNFNNVGTGTIRNNGLTIKGQSVNNTFLGCSFSTGGTGHAGIEINGDNYNTNQYRRPEGNSFVGGFVGYASFGVNLIDALSTIFSNLIIDLNDYGVYCHTADYATFTDCWINAITQIPVNFDDRSSPTNLINVTFKGCKMVVGTAGKPAVYAGLNQTGLIFDGNFMDNFMQFNTGCTAVIKNNYFVTPPTTNATIIAGGANLITLNNVFKDNSAVVIG